MNKIDKLMAEVRECRSQLELAWQDLDYAQVDYVDSAIFKIKSSATFKNSGCSIGTPSNPVDNNVIQQLKDSISGKVDKVAGKGLSTNDYTTAEKNKLASLPDDFEGACTDAEIEAMLKELGL